MGCGPIQDQWQGQIPTGQAEYLISFYVDNNSWHMDVIEHLLSMIIVPRLRLLDPPIQNVEADFLNWILNLEGQFSFKSAYEILAKQGEDKENEHDSMFLKAWEWHDSDNIRSFIWKLAYRKILTNMEQKRCNMMLGDTCPHFNSNPKYVMHIYTPCLWVNVRIFE